MTRIVLTEEQAKLLSPTELIQICDPGGRLLAVIPPDLTPEELAKIPRAKDCTGPWVTSEQIRQTLQTLEETWQREGPFGVERAREIVEHIRAARGS